MTRQYKSRFEELTEKDKILKKEIDMNSETIQDLDDRYKKIYEEKNTIEKNKLEEIKGLKTQIDAMSQEFATMLKSTLDKMQ
jgi:molybdopterin converting factor small subunit